MYMWKSLRPASLRLACFCLSAAVPLAAQIPRIQWVRQHGTARFDVANAVGYGEFGVYAAGQTSDAFPGQTNSGNKDAFISLHDELGNLKWVRQFGTSAEDTAMGVAGDGSGAYVVGYTYGALTSLGAGADSYIRKYGPDGDVLWTRQFGAQTDDVAAAVATHRSGVYVVGYVECCGGILPGQVLPAAGTDAYIRKYNGDGVEQWTRVFGTADIERALGVAVDETGVYVAGITAGDFAGPRGGRDGFVRKFSYDGAVLWTRQFGTRDSNGDFATDDFTAIAAASGGVFVVGATARGVIPGGTFAGGLWDAFILKLDQNGNQVWIRQIGTDGDDYCYSVAVGVGHVLVGGGTSSNLVSGAFVGGEDAFLRMYDFNGDVLGTLQFGNGLNDSVLGIVASPGGFFAAGTKNGSALEQQVFGDNDAYVMRIAPPPFLPEGAVLNAATFKVGPLAPGSIAIVFGAYLNDGPQVLSTALGLDGKVVSSLGGTRVLVQNIPAPILYSTASQVAFQVPFELEGESVAGVVVQVAGQTSNLRVVGLARAAPGFFTQNQQGTGAAIVLHEDGITVVTPQNPAKRGEVVVFYLTGLGVLNPRLETGVPAGANQAQAQVAIAFGTANTTPEYAGASPGFIGLNQINVRIPSGAPVGSDIPVSITVGGTAMANPVTIAIAQ